MNVQIEKKNIYNRLTSYYEFQKEKLRVAAYARVSTMHDDQLLSFNSQIKYYIEKINSNDNWELVKIYADEGVSATKVTYRPEFIKMMKEANRGKIDLIITKSISRFARNTLDTLKYIKYLKEKILVYILKKKIFIL